MVYWNVSNNVLAEKLDLESNFGFKFFFQF